MYIEQTSRSPLRFGFMDEKFSNIYIRHTERGRSTIRVERACFKEEGEQPEQNQIGC